MAVRTCPNNRKFNKQKGLLTCCGLLLVNFLYAVFDFLLHICNILGRLLVYTSNIFDKR